MNEDRDKSPHILNASSNLLGLCFVVLTSLKLLHLSQTTLIDELTLGATLLFMASCLLSFLALRGHQAARNQRYERTADYLFMAGIIFLFLTTLLFSFNLLT